MKKSLLLAVVALLVALGWRFYPRDSSQTHLSGIFENQPTLVSSRVQGRVKRLAVQEGATVQAGQLLLELESQASQSELESVRRQADEARQKYLEVQAGTRPEEIRRQQAVVEELAAALDRLRNGSRPEEIAQARAAERTAQARYAQARRGLTPEERGQLQARLDSARAEEKITQVEVSRFTTLWEKDEISRQDFDRKRATAERARQARKEAEEAYLRAARGTPAEELEQARQQWLQARASSDLVANGSRSEDIRAAQARWEGARALLDQLRNGQTREQRAQRKAAMQSAEANLRSQSERVQERLVRAPQAGVVEAIPVAVGDLINPGTTVLRLSDPGDVWMRVYVPADKLPLIKAGSPARLRVDGIAQQLNAHVDSISPRGEFKPANLQSPEERARQVYAVKLRLDKPEARIKPGLYANVMQLGEWRL